MYARVERRVKKKRIEKKRRIRRSDGCGWGGDNVGVIQIQEKRDNSKTFKMDNNNQLKSKTDR